MPISSVDRNTQAKAQERDDAQQLRNEYNERESQAAKRQKKEVQNLTQQYEKDLEKLATDYDHRATSQSKHTGEALSDKDRKYQGEIDELKKMHVQKLRDMTEKNQGETMSLREAKDTDLKLIKDRHERQEGEIRHKFENALSDTEKNADHMTNETREKMRENMKAQRNELTQAHQTETNQLKANRDESVGELKEGLQHTRDNDRRALMFEKEAHLRDNQLHDKRTMDTVLEERIANNQVMDETRGGAKRALQDESQKYAHALQKRDESMNDVGGSFRNTVMKRQDDQVGRLESDLIKERASNKASEAGVRKMSNIERDHITQQYQNRFDELDKRNQGQVLANNDLRKKDIEQVHKTYDQVVVNANKRARDEIEAVRGNEVEPYKQQLSQVELRDQEHQREAGNRDQKLTNIRNRDVKTVSNYYESKLEANRNGADDMMHEQQLKARTDQSQMMQRYEVKLQNVQQALEQRHEAVVSHYENTIADMKSKYENEFRRQQELNDQRAREQDHKAATDLEREKASNLIQQTAIRDRYEKELDFVRKRNDQEKIELAKRKV